MTAAQHLIIPRLLAQSPIPARVQSGRRFFTHGPSRWAGNQIAPSGSTPPSQIPHGTQQRIPNRNQGRSGAFYIIIMAAAVLSVPPISYLYWEHRKAHMKAKKEAILKELQAKYAS